MGTSWQTKTVTRYENICSIYMCSFKHRYSATTEAVNWAFWRTFSLFLFLNTVHVVILSSYPASCCMANSSSCCTSPGFKNSVFNKFMCTYLCAWTIYIQKDERKIWILYEEISRNLFGLQTVQSGMHLGGVLYGFSPHHFLTIDATKLIFSN